MSDVVVRLPFGRYFTPDEMRCRDGTAYPEQWALRLAILFDALDTLREEWGGPLVIVSGYRTPEHNRAVGGARNSQHVQGRAVDLRPRFKDRRATKHDIVDLASAVDGLLAHGRLPAIGGVGVYPLVKDSRSKLHVPGWVHLDIRPRKADGSLARWRGDGFGSEVGS